VGSFISASRAGGGMAGPFISLSRAGGGFLMTGGARGMPEKAGVVGESPMISSLRVPSGVMTSLIGERQGVQVQVAQPWA